MADDRLPDKVVMMTYLSQFYEVLRKESAAASRPAKRKLTSWHGCLFTFRRTLIAFVARFRVAALQRHCAQCVHFLFSREVAGRRRSCARASTSRAAVTRRQNGAAQ